MRYLSLILIFFLSAGLLERCSDPSQQEEAGIAEKYPAQESWNSTITISKLEKRNARVGASHILQYEEPERIIFDNNVQGDLYKDNQHSSTLTADSAIYLKEDEIMRAYGNVVVKSDSGITLYTPKLMYSQKTEKITSDTTVKVTTDIDTLYGVGLESNPDLTDLQILKPRGLTWRELNE